MIKVIYTNKLDASKQQSDFETQAQLGAHKIEHPEMYDDSMFDVVESDITVQVLKQKNIEKYLKRIQFGQVLMAELAAMNKASLDAGQLTSEQIIILKQELAPIKDFVSEGSLGFALAALNQSASLPLALKGYFVTKISNYLGSE